MTFSAEPLIINLAPTGMTPMRSHSGKVPLQPREVVSDVLTAAEKGITIAHLHARDQRDEPTHSKEVYARIIGGIRERRPDIVICVSCSGRKARIVQERAEVLELDGDLKPDMASLTLSSLNFPRQASINEPATIRALAERMQQRGIVPELEIFDLGMINMVRYLLDRGLLRPPLYANLIVGNLASTQADLLEIGALAHRLPAQTTWSLGGIGTTQLPVAAIAAAFAPGVRIGLEDNLWLDPDRVTLASNSDLIDRVHQFAEILHRPIMSPLDFRRRFAMELTAAHTRLARAA